MSSLFNRDRSFSTIGQAELQSSTIDLLRFPLAIMVMFIHTNRNTFSITEASTFTINDQIFNIIKILLSDVLPSIAVPSFFLISGYLFFTNFQKWSWDAYKGKLKSRFFTLLIPYLVWNTLPVILRIVAILSRIVLYGDPISCLLSYLNTVNWSFLFNCSNWVTATNWLGNDVTLTGPYDIPLWFLRDLIVVTVLTPIIYYAIRKFKIYFIILLFLAYVSKIWIWIPGFSITALFFFGTGAYFALQKLNIVQFSTKYKYYFVLGSFFLIILSVICHKGNLILYGTARSLYTCTGLFTAFYLASQSIKRYNIIPNRFLVASCFFIYAFHVVPLPVIGNPLAFPSLIIHKVIPGSPAIANGLTYLLSPFITAVIGLLILKIARKILPKTTMLFTGNR